MSEIADIDDLDDWNRLIDGRRPLLKLSTVRHPMSEDNFDVKYKVIAIHNSGERDEKWEVDAYHWVTGSSEKMQWLQVHEKTRNCNFLINPRYIKYIEFDYAKEASDE